MSSAPDICSPQVGPFRGVFEDRTFETGGVSFRIVAYRAYDACGLIGSENNGIALLNEDNRDVVLDEHMQHNSGYSMNELKLRKEIERISGLSPSELMDFILKNGRHRYVPDITMG